MRPDEWESLGKTVKNMVESAVDSGDFSKLNQSIRNVVNTAVDTAARGLEDGLNSAGIILDLDNQQGHGKKKNKGNGWNPWQEHNTRQNEHLTEKSREYRDWQQRQQARYDGRWQNAGNGVGGMGAKPMLRQGQYTPARRVQNELFERMTRHQVIGGLMAGGGYGLAFLFGAIFTGSLLSGAAIIGFNAATIAALGIFGTFLAGSIGVGCAGMARIGKAKRFSEYVRALQGKYYIDLEQLGTKLQRPVKYIRKDLQKMIGLGWFKQGHIDQSGKCLIVTDKLYEEYLDNLQQSESLRLEEQQKEELRQAQKMERDGTLPPEAREVLGAGHAFLVKIRKCNDEIPGEEISAKISKIEEICARIFERVEKHPENVPNVRKMMDYYLPTTVKLLEAYEELDRQTVQGENIEHSKKEIEDTLDTLNAAFEKLLDEMFRNTAWDVSTDISVLKTMLAQEGLAERDFK